jgi:predicted phage-related endonuclease
MADAPSPRNIPVPDELAAVRQQIKALETHEAELKQILLSDPSARTGAQWVAEIKEIETNRVDIKELRAMHKDLVEEYTFPQKITRIELSGISEDGELIPARQMRSAAKSGDTPQ